MEVCEYEDLIQHLMKMDKVGKTFWMFENILDHKQTGKKNIGGWLLLVEWTGGEETWQSLQLVRQDAPLEVVKYARDNDLLGHKELY